MKQFLKFIFASCLGTILAFGGILFIFMIVGSAGTTSVTISDHSVLHLKLNHSIPELTDNIAPGQFGISQGLAVGLNDITRLIREARYDDKISGLFLQTESAMMNPTTAYIIAREIESFRTSGKFVYAYGDYFTQSGYILASMADSVFLNPNGLIDLRGYGMIMPYFKNFSDKTGIDFDVYHAGKYKSAIEPFYRSESSVENRSQSKQYLGNYHKALVSHIANQRNKTSEDVDQIVTQGLSNNSEDAMKNGLVDALRYPEDVSKMIKGEVSNMKLVSLETYHQANPKSKANHKNKIAVIYAEGEVASGGKARGSISMEVYDEIFDRVEKNNNIKAVVLRVNSPGGSSFTSDRFMKRINDLSNNGKYIVASFGDYAASGGYYIAAGADKIISEATTLTGSIGVFSMMPDLSGFSEDELGINWDTIGTGKRTFLYSQFVSRSPGDNALLMAETERVYHQFKNIVANGRDLDIEMVDSIAQGRVWSGIDAVEVSLVDTLGGVFDAIAIAAEAAGYEEYKILEYPIIKKDFWEKMLESLAAETQVKITRPKGVVSAAFDELLKNLSLINEACSTPQARLPFSISIH